ncbi:phospholipase D-like domain-containing protein [Nocardioides flavescens]|uniref:phospholipase D n=1 Tax=Nocardioides flavescens TaxID=2691959 RepID=A0A6L7EWQ4_9ACTN|nr:hypothetical protein [Nocardioides flavescens]
MTAVRFAVLALVATLLAVAPTPVTTEHAEAAKATKGYRAPEGPFFNNPRGSQAAKFRIERQVLAAIRATPKRSTIRIALYSFDRMPVAEALAAAHRRGVKVQLLLNDHQDTKAMKYLRARLGTNRWASSFIYKCRSGCRSATPDRNLHSKFYTFTEAGKSKRVLMVGSANMMLNAHVHQWNDLFITSGRRAMFDQYVALFNDMKRDWSTKRPAYTFCGTPRAGEGQACDEAVDKFTTQVFPRTSNRRDDPVLEILDRVQCVTDGRRTKLDLSMHSMRGQRGNYLAAALRQKYAEGCQVRVDYGLIGFRTKQVLGKQTPRGRVPLRSTGFDRNGDGEVELYTHQKYLVIRGTYAGRPRTSLTFTGSSNWAGLGTAQDEVLFSIRGAGVARKYVRNFDLMWKGRGNSRPAYTTTYASFRSLIGMPTRVTSVEPDGLRPGATWEDD